MTDAVVVARPGAFAQVRVQEPAGERTLSPPTTIGGAGADIVVPGTAAGVALQIERREGVWIAQSAASAAVRFDGRLLREPRDLRRGDVIAVGEAHVIVLEASRTLLRLDVCHLVGNDTITPMDVVASLGSEGDETGDDVEIRRLPVPALLQPTAAASPAAAEQVVSSERPPRRWSVWAGGIAALILLLAVTVVASLLEPVGLDILPADAQVTAPGTLVSLRSGNRMLMLPGRQRLRADLKGYVSNETVIVVKEDNKSSVKMRLTKLPGKLNIDTSGVAASVGINGVEVGKAPGEIQIPAGSHTLTLRAPRYLDYVTTVKIVGAGERQEIKAQLKPSWGSLQISSIPANAQVFIDGADRGAAPAVLDADAGVRSVKLVASGLKSWESTVVIKAGETLKVGPITLGQPDAHLTLRSAPSGAEVTVGGAFHGRTPVTVDLAAGVAHDVVVSLPGHESWTRSIFADPGKAMTVDAKLVPILASVTIQGEPADAEILVDGKSRGNAPQKMSLTTIEHRLEVRKAEYVPFLVNVTPAKGLERSVQYKLTPTDRGAALMESAPRIQSKIGYTLLLMPHGTFIMGSERREQGRRPNEISRQVTLQRPFYLGVNEVTNTEFRKFRPDHKSGFVEKRSFDLDNQPVTKVSWGDAAEFCNWLSEQDGLPPAYERRGDTYELKRPVTTGYRLPTEAEWEFSARYAAPSRMRRFTWGNELPVAQQVGNLAGTEAAAALPTVLEGYRDEYVGIAPVGKFPANALGLHDMSGNVTEWMNDYYLSFVATSTAVDPLGPEQSSRRVIRGANWMTASVGELRLAWRDGANESSQTLGFRVARYAE